MFNYGAIRFQLLPGGMAVVIDRQLSQSQRWAGPREDALPDDALELWALRDELVAHVFGVSEDGLPADAGVQFACADAASPEPGKPYARVWSDSREATRDFACSDALTPAEIGRLRALLAQLATHAECPEHDNTPPARARAGARHG